MSDFKLDLNELKSKATQVAGTVWEQSLLLKDAAGEKVRILTQKAKLRAALARNSSELNRLYADLGSLYYCVRRDDPDSEMKQMCEEITVLLEKNDEIQQELSELASAESPVLEPEIEPETGAEADGEAVPEAAETDAETTKPEA